MKTVVESDLKPQTFCVSKSYTRLKEKEINSVNFKFYQKIIIVLISFSTILIFPEFPKELENICESNNPKELCNVW